MKESERLGHAGRVTRSKVTTLTKDGMYPEGNCLLCRGGTYSHEEHCPTRQFDRLIAKYDIYDVKALADELMRISTIGPPRPLAMAA